MWLFLVTIILFFPLLLKAQGIHDFVVVYALSKADPRMEQLGMIRNTTISSIRDTIWILDEFGFASDTALRQSTSVYAHGYQAFVRHSLRWATHYTQEPCDNDPDHPKNLGFDLGEVLDLKRDSTILGYPCHLYEVRYVAPQLRRSAGSQPPKATLYVRYWVTPALEPYLYKAFANSSKPINGTVEGVRGVSLQSEVFQANGEFISRSTAQQVLVGQAALSFTFVKDIPSGYFIEHYVCPDN